MLFVDIVLKIFVFAIVDSFVFRDFFVVVCDGIGVFKLYFFSRFFARSGFLVCLRVAEKYRFFFDKSGVVVTNYLIFTYDGI